MWLGLQIISEPLWKIGTAIYTYSMCYYSSFLSVLQAVHVNRIGANIISLQTIGS